MRILFSYIAQPHQTLHSLPIAMEMAILFPELEVHVACLTDSHLEYVKSLSRYYPTAHVHYDLLYLPKILRNRISTAGYDVLTKMAALWLNRRNFSTFDAIVVPERTSLYLKTMGVKHPKLIWTRHGAGDRAIGFAKDTKNFDFILFAGKKLKKRLEANGTLKPGRYVEGIYAKFDLVEKMRNKRKPLFNNNAPIVLYNPHFKNSLSSWKKFGIEILQQFAEQKEYNFIFAPHFRLFDPPSKKELAYFSQFSRYDHLLIDLGSYKSVDMTYTQMADMYIGDVSSQVAEFLTTPRPCLFLNAHKVQWHSNPNYRFWELGEVSDNADNIIEQVKNVFSNQHHYSSLQEHYIQETFSSLKLPTAPKAARAIVDFLGKNL
ncbi:CDP-glycerol glycerophosphotransferase family protein [Entomobacter blattae]|uniref:Glycerophosphotransferase n=1 Tax=Entomobacter blattae TaxID=2762277 RepID=A0A7H1NP95_9PROT|nr:CDP-glycerol glycerophosphotransferase family protein [Entomobacter blattae]QNT77605.1 hypothetical protein JGUZn3_03540 [Entomobacter blattae]